MQLTARAHRSSDSGHNVSSFSDDHDDDGTPRRHGKSSVDGSHKSFRRPWQKRFNTTQAIIWIRRLQYHWELLSRKAKVISVLLLCFLGQSVLFGLWDQLFFDVGIIGQPLTHSTAESYFAVAINTYKRPEMLKDAVQHYADTCGRSTGVSQVFIIWAEQTSQVPSPDSFFDSNLIRGKSLSNRAAVHVLKKAKDSLNSRFEPIAELETTAVFMVDDDLRVSCSSLQQAFQAWNAHPDSMVGYYPRLASPPRGESSTSNVLIYHTWPVVFWKQSFNLVLTKASFLHSKYLELYSNDQHFPRAVKDHVDQHKNCEDIAMSMLVANYTRYQTGNPATPIYVEGRVSDKGLVGGISTGSGHMTTRSDCLTQLTAILQKQGWEPPLQYQVSLRQFSWIRHAPGFWWQYRPSNLFEWFALGNTFS